MMLETGFEITNLEGKCHNCKHYEPLIKNPCKRTGIITKFCRGHCLLHRYKDGKPMYKQRTETCKKFVEVA